MTVPVLSQAWLDRYAELAEALPPRPGATAVVQHVVAKTPDGDVTYHLRWEDGRLGAAALGPAEGPDVTVQESWPDAQVRARGEADLAVAFMRGRAKVAAPTALLLALQPLWQSPELAAVEAALAAETEV